MVLTGCTSRVYTYRSDATLELRGSFYGNVSAGNTRIVAKFIVPQGNSGCLLGRETATLLGLLHINANIVNSVNHNGDDDGPQRKKVSELLSKYKDVTKGLGKLKDTQVKYDIDPDIKPVAQHLRKIPFHVGKPCLP